MLRRLEFHYTPKHASWLNMAEIEISIFERACLGRRVESVEQLWQRIGAVETDRNARQCRIHWRFTKKKEAADSRPGSLPASLEWPPKRTSKREACPLGSFNIFLQQSPFTYLILKIRDDPC